MANTDGLERLQELIGVDYRLQWIIGRGGMSTVWLADDLLNDREVAIKVLRPEFSDNREFLDRFRYEAVASENIDSENVVRTYDYQEVPDPSGHTFCFIVMEYVRGESLADLLSREKQLDESLVLDVLEQAAHGLSIIHRMDLVHRDIKPGNLMITQNGQVKITDFGIAKAAAAVPLTRTGMIVGTAQYVSPEQAQGQKVTSASDVYSLGVVGYEMLAGQRPFTGDSSVSVAIAHIGHAPPAMSAQVSAQTRELIGITLRKDPLQRYANGNEMALAVSAVRLGNRPPQPQSAAMTQIAREPSPTESTRILGATAHPTTVQPATIVASQVARPTTAVTKRPASNNGAGLTIGILLSVIIAGLLGGGLYLAYQSGLLEGVPGGEENTTAPLTTESEIITEWVTPTETPPAPAPTPTPEPSPTAPEGTQTQPEGTPTSETIAPTTAEPVTPTPEQTSPEPPPVPPTPTNPPAASPPVTDSPAQDADQASGPLESPSIGDN